MALGEAQPRHSRARDGEGPNEKPRLDFGADIDKAIISKVPLKDRYRVLVPSVDADGNETAGTLPDITVHSESAAASANAKTKAERE